MAGKAETTGTKEPPSTTTSPRTPTALLPRITARKITVRDTSIPNRRWNSQPRRTNIRRKLTRNRQAPSLKQQRRRPSSEARRICSTGIRRGGPVWFCKLSLRQQFTCAASSIHLCQVCDSPVIRQPLRHRFTFNRENRTATSSTGTLPVWFCKLSQRQQFACVRPAIHE